MDKAQLYSLEEDIQHYIIGLVMSQVKQNLDN